MSTRNRTALLCGVAVCVIVVGSYVYKGHVTPLQSVSLPEMTFNELSDYFVELAQVEGAESAIASLRTAKLPPGTDVHLLGHAIGDELYRQEGLAGMATCTDEFRNACSHAIVIGALLEFGEGALTRIRSVCEGAPGGRGAYTMCLHGLGHGLLAYTGYSVEETAALCKDVETKEMDGAEYAHCVSGAVMELIGGGGHDRALWESQRATQLSPQDPLALCKSEIIEDRARPLCYTYLTPYLFEVVGADLGYPTSENFRDAFELCGSIPESEIENRDACYGGLGKEFAGLVRGRDVRAIEDLSLSEMRTVHGWCGLSGSSLSTRACIESAMQALYWGGENEPDAAIRFCTVATRDFEDDCFAGFFAEVAYYADDSEDRTAVCEAVGEGRVTECRDVLGI